MRGRIRLLAVPLTIVLALPAFAGCLGQGADVQPAAAPAEGQLREFDMWIKIPVDWQARNGSTVMGMFAFGPTRDGPWTIPGPEIRVTEGDHVRVRLHSTDHTLHWHGVSVPWAMDGVPFMTQTVTPVPKKGMYVYDFVARETGTYWYHCHVDAPSHVDAGLYGAFIVEPRDKSLDPPFDREYTLMLGDVDSEMFQAINAVGGNSTIPGTPLPDPSPTYLDPPENPGDLPEYAVGNVKDTYDIAGAFIAPGIAGSNLPGTMGPRDYYPVSSLRYEPHYDTFMINGKSFPDTKPLLIKTGETIRVRLINAGQLIHTMHLHGHHFLVTHKDGYPLPAGARYYADSLMVAPGERYDVYVKGDNIGIWDFHDHGGSWGAGAYADSDHAFPGGMGTMLVYQDFTFAKLPGPEPAGGWTSGDY
ncbi:MAG: multicopper oxidase domain-containing protein, partial [Halobacteriales archaeon]|nr:multicopper oxidase domain-containing protein [Halobacteriales archaeon]